MNAAEPSPIPKYCKQQRAHRIVHVHVSICDEAIGEAFGIEPSNLFVRHVLKRSDPLVCTAILECVIVDHGSRLHRLLQDLHHASPINDFAHLRHGESINAFKRPLCLALCVLTLKAEDQVRGIG